MTFKGAGGQTFAVTNSLAPLTPVTHGDTQVYASTMTGFAFRTASNVSAGSAAAVTLSAVDAYGNTVTGYRGKVHFTGSSGSTLPADYQFTALDGGTHTFNVTFANTGTATLNVSDLLDNKLKSSTSITVKAAINTGGGGGGGGGGGKKVV